MPKCGYFESYTPLFMEIMKLTNPKRISMLENYISALKRMWEFLKTFDLEFIALSESKVKFNDF